MPDDDRSDRLGREEGSSSRSGSDHESRRSSGRDSGRGSSTENERDELGRFESERSGSSQSGGSSKKK